MRDAITLHRDPKKGWFLKHGPEVSPGQQRAEFRDAAAGKMPKGVDAIRFQEGHGTKKEIDLRKAEVIAKRLEQADLKSALHAAKSKLVGEADKNERLIRELTDRLQPARVNARELQEKFLAVEGTKFAPERLAQAKGAQILLEELEKQLAAATARQAELLEKLKTESK